MKVDVLFWQHIRIWLGVIFPFNYKLHPIEEEMKENVFLFYFSHINENGELY